MEDRGAWGGGLRWTETMLLAVILISVLILFLTSKEEGSMNLIISNCI